MENKELEASKRIRKLLEDKYGLLIYVDDLALIETALKILENYEQNEDFSKDVLNYAFLNEQDKIKKLKALEIIKEKDIYISCIKIHFKNNLDYKSYNSCVRETYRFITEEEYDLLKEVLL